MNTLKGDVQGELILPGDAGYHEARKLYNGMIDKHPAAILKCVSEEDVVAGVNFAREQGLEVAIRSGGHSGAGLGSVDDGLVLDLGPLKRVQVDAVGLPQHQPYVRQRAGEGDGDPARLQDAGRDLGQQRKIQEVVGRVEQGDVGPAPGEPAGHLLDHPEVRADDRHVLDGELLVGEVVDGRLGALVGVVGADLDARATLFLAEGATGGVVLVVSEGVVAISLGDGER